MASHRKRAQANLCGLHLVIHCTQPPRLHRLSETKKKGRTNRRFHPPQRPQSVEPPNPSRLVHPSCNASQVPRSIIIVVCRASADAAAHCPTTQCTGSTKIRELQSWRIPHDPGTSVGTTTQAVAREQASRSGRGASAFLRRTLR